MHRIDLHALEGIVKILDSRGELKLSAVLRAKGDDESVGVSDDVERLLA